MGKVGTAGRFGTRYGKKVRSKVAEIEKKQKERQVCPSCNMQHVKRVSSGIWQCYKCGNKFASQAYFVRTEI